MHFSSCSPTPTSQHDITAAIGVLMPELASVIYKGYEYATLDRTSPNSGLNSQEDVDTQTDFIEVPAGWELAPDTDIVRQLSSMHPWGTHVLIGSDGVGYYTTTCNNRGNRHSTGLLQMDTMGRYKPTGSCMRILVKQKTGMNHLIYCSKLSSTLWLTKRFTDCAVVCGTSTTQCHRAVLAAASPVFEAMLSSGMAEDRDCHIEIRDADPETVELMLAFAYTGTVLHGIEEYLGKLICLADRYQMASLSAFCSEWALENFTDNSISGETIGTVIRSIRALKDKPEIQPLWNKLLDLLQSKRELLSTTLALI